LQNICISASETYTTICVESAEDYFGLGLA